MVRRLVQQQGLGPREQDASELDPTTLAARERVQGLPEDALVECRGCWRCGRPPTRRRIPERRELSLESRVASHRRVARLVDRRCHRTLGLPHAGDHLVQPAGRQDAVEGQHVEVAGAGVLRQVPDLPAARDRACRGLSFAGEHLREGRLAGTIAADQADPVAGTDAERHVLHENAGTNAQFDTVGRDHCDSSAGWTPSRGRAGQGLPHYCNRGPELTRHAFRAKEGA